MSIIDAVHVLEPVGGILLGMSGIAFIALGIFIGTRQKSAEVPERSVRHKLDLVANTEKRPVSKKAPARKAA